jgi:hypothetical protein
MSMTSREVMTLVFFQNLGKWRWLPVTRWSARGVGAFQEDVVVGIAGDLKRPGGLHDLRVALDELHDLPAEALADLSSGRASTSRYSARMAS